MDSQETTAPAAATHPSALVAALPQEQALLTAIVAAASDASVDVAKMERLLAMHEKISADQARRAYSEALHAFQAECPPIHRSRGIVVSGQTRSRYAAYEDVIRTVGPLLQRHGFAASYDTKSDDRGTIQSVTCTLSHVGGHFDQSTFPVAPDTSGSKNNIQAIGSALAYGKRYALGAILGLVFSDEDDDARSVSAAAEAKAEVAIKTKKAPAPQEAVMSDPTDRDSIIDGIMERMEVEGMTHENLTDTLAKMMPKAEFNDWSELDVKILARLNTDDGFANVVAKWKGGEA